MLLQPGYVGRSMVEQGPHKVVVLLRFNGREVHAVSRHTGLSP